MTPPKLAVPTNMRPYTVVFLQPGPNYEALSDRSIPANLALQAAHLDTVRANYEAGLQILAAPIMTPGSQVSAFGIFHSNIPVEQLTEVMQNDPAIAAGRFTFQIVQAMLSSLDGVKMEY
jgi:hypothetical protein